ncbi:MAG: metal ABC transporter substrate-binding protein, partial [Candidatus Marinamargulisbacteria bacterium]
MCFNNIGIIFISIFLTTVAFAKVTVVTTTSDLAAIARKVGGSHIHVTSLVKGSRNLHNIVPRPSMVTALRTTDMIIRIGMEQDSWLDGVIQVAKNPRLLPGQKGHLNASQGITKLEVPSGNIDGRRGDVHIEGNPHYLLNPLNGAKTAMLIAKRLSEIDPKNSTVYHQNARALNTEITQKMKVWTQTLRPLKTTSFITYHRVWSYFFDAFDLVSAGELEPIPGIPPSAKRIHHMIKAQQKTPMPSIILVANYYPKHAGATMAKRLN